MRARALTSGRLRARTAQIIRPRADHHARRERVNHHRQHRSSLSNAICVIPLHRGNDDGISASRRCLDNLRVFCRVTRGRVACDNERSDATRADSSGKAIGARAAISRTLRVDRNNILSGERRSRLPRTCHRAHTTHKDGYVRVGSYRGNLTGIFQSQKKPKVRFLWSTLDSTRYRDAAASSKHGLRSLLGRSNGVSANGVCFCGPSAKAFGKV